MNIIVCIKQVPEPEYGFTIQRAGNGIVINDTCESRMNRFDEYALEAALVLREKNFSGAGIHLITVGPSRAVEVLKRGIGMGADGGIHVLCPDGDYISPFETAGWMAAVLCDRKYDLILTGAMSEDQMQAQTGPLLAELLDIPSITSVISIETMPAPDSLLVEKELEGGERDVLQITAPALLAVQPGINRPRYPSLSNLLRANRSSPETMEASEMPSTDPRQTRQGIRHPRKERAGRMLEGSMSQKADTLLQILHRKSLVKTV